MISISYNPVSRCFAVIVTLFGLVLAIIALVVVLPILVDQKLKTAHSSKGKFKLLLILIKSI